MIPFAPPHIDEKVIEAVTEVLRSGWITTGPQTKLFERKLSEYNGNAATLCLNSATAGLELMLRWYGVGLGDEVILPAYTYSATANVVLHCGATPVFVDVAHDFNIDPKNIRNAITPRTKVIMPVDFGGLPCDYKAIHDIVNDAHIQNQFVAKGEEQKKLARILVLSDAAHSIGGKYREKRTGSLTDVSVFSFHAVKNLTTAEGGAISLNLPAPFDNQAVYAALCIKSLHGQNKDALAKMQKGNWRYDIVEPGYKYNMTDIMAAIGLVELERYESEILPARKKICDYYTRHLAPHKWAVTPLQQEATRQSSYHLYALRIKGISEAQRDGIIAKIFDKEVSVNVHFIPLPMLSYYKGLGYDIAHYPKTYEYYACEISLPVFVGLDEHMCATVVEAVVSAVEAELAVAH